MQPFRKVLQQDLKKRGSIKRKNEVFRCMLLHKQQKIIYSLQLKVMADSIDERPL